MWFKPKRPVDAEEWEWLLAGFQWLGREFPDLDARRLLAVPSNAFFPPSQSRGAERGVELMAQVQAIAGMADWPVQLVPVQPPRRGAVNAVAALQTGSGACGSFRAGRTAEGIPVAEIRYTFDQLDNPAGLVATFAHELAHYLLHTRTHPVPGGDEVEELFTDLTAVWLGFGIFLGNNARYSGHIDEGAGRGWFVSGWQGYLGERMLMTALALSEMLAGRDALAAAPYLKTHLETDLRAAQRYASRRDVPAEMHAVDLAEFGA
ncbi:MAG TPA: hypothetical protein VF079_09990 [Sphingomicrobium sp.]